MSKPKLNLRDLFALVTIMAVLAAWWADRRSHAIVLQSLEAEKARREMAEANNQALHRQWAAERARNTLLQRDSNCVNSASDPAGPDEKLLGAPGE